ENPADAPADAPAPKLAPAPAEMPIPAPALNAAPALRPAAALVSRMVPGASRRGFSMPLAAATAGQFSAFPEAPARSETVSFFFACLRGRPDDARLCTPLADCLPPWNWISWRVRLAETLARSG